VGLLVAATVVAPLVTDYRSYVITGDSMDGEFGRGTLVYEREVPVSELMVGDVITYTPPLGEGPGGLVTHRIYSIEEDPRLGTVYVTKGDANRDPDPWKFTLEEATQPRVVAEVPYVGYAYAALSVRPVRLALIGLPALLLAFAVLRRMWREAGEEVRRAGDAQPQPAATLP
jgi:signal peptidase I